MESTMPHTSCGGICKPCLLSLPNAAESIAAAMLLICQRSISLIGVSTLNGAGSQSTNPNNDPLGCASDNANAAKGDEGNDNSACIWYAGLDLALRGSPVLTSHSGLPWLEHTACGNDDAMLAKLEPSS